MLKKCFNLIRKFFSFAMVLLFIIPAGIIASAAPDWVSWNGKGLIDSPYLLQSPEDFTLLSENVNEGINYKNTYFKLRYPIDLSSLAQTWMPIGNEENPFSGIFDGDNKDIVCPNNALFGYLGLPEGESAEENAVPTIKNIKIAEENKFGYNPKIKYGTSFSAVVLVNHGIVQSCSNYGRVNLIYSNLRFYSGGIVGTNYALVKECVNYGTVGGESRSSGGYFGGIVAMNYGTILSCVNEGIVASKAEDGKNIGGIVGYSEGNVAECINNGKVIGYRTYVGGIIGTNYEGTINGCINNEKISGSNSRGFGGICGSDTLGLIENCVNYSRLGDAGGILAEGSGSTIRNCFNFGELSGSVGGIAYRANANDNIASVIENCANFADLSGGSLAGIVLYGNVTVRYCFNSGNLSGSSAQGIGGAIIESCYNSGDFRANCAFGITNSGTVKNSYNSGKMVADSYIISGLCLPVLQSGTAINSYYNGPKNDLFPIDNGETSLTFAEMTENSVLEAEGKMNALSSDIWTKRENDSEYSYFPALKYFANHENEIVRQESLESVQATPEKESLTPTIDLQALPNFEQYYYDRIDISALVQGNGEVEPTGSIIFQYPYHGPINNPQYVFSRSIPLSGGSVDYTTEAHNSERLTPGEYTVSAHYPGDENYNPTYTIITYVVGKYAPIVETPKISIIYDPDITLKDIELPLGWTWDNPDIVPPEGDNLYSATYSLSGIEIGRAHV